MKFESSSDCSRVDRGPHRMHSRNAPTSQAVKGRQYWGGQRGVGHPKGIGGAGVKRKGRRCERPSQRNTLKVVQSRYQGLPAKDSVSSVRISGETSWMQVCRDKSALSEEGYEEKAREHSS